MGKHTPGPWVAVHPEGDERSLDVYPANNPHYKIMHGKWGGMDDARLVAAAPDGFEAVRAFLADYDAVNVGAGERFHLKQQHIEAFRAFVAKAEGRHG